MAKVPVSSRWRLFAAAAVAVPPLVALGLWAALGLGVVRAQVAALISAALSDQGTTVEIAALEGSLPHAPRLIGITVSDRDGPLVSIDRITIAWRPLALLRGRLHVPGLSVDEVRIFRLPEGGGEDKPFVPPDLPLAVVLERLEVARIVVAEAVLGADAVFSAQGRLAAPRLGEIDAGLDLVRSDGGAGHATFGFVLDQGRGAIDISLDINEPAGGLLAALLDLPGRPAVSIGLDGGGAIDDWRGRLRVAAQGLGGVEADVVVDARAAVSAAAQGRAEVWFPLPDPARRLLGDGVDFDLRAAWDIGAGRVEVSRLDVVTRALTIEGAGTLALEALALDARAAALLSDHAVVTEFLPGATVGEVRAGVELTGHALDPAIIMALDLVRPTFEGLAAARVNARSALRLGDTLGLEGGLEVGGLTGLPDPVAEALGRDMTLSWTAMVDTKTGVIEFSPLIVEANGARLSAVGSVPLSLDAVDMGVGVEVSDLGPLVRAFGIGDVVRSGRGEAEAHVQGTVSDGLSATFGGTLDGLGFADAALAEVVGRRMGFGGDAGFRPGQGLGLDGLGVELRVGTVSGAARIDMDAGRIEGDWRARIPDLSLLSGLAGAELGGAVTAAGTVAGALSAPAVRGRLDLVEGRHDDIAPIAAGADFSLAPDGRVAVSDLSVRAVGAWLDGRFDLVPEGGGRTGFDARVAGEAGVPLSLSAGGAVSQGAIDLDRLQGTVAGLELALAAPARLRRSEAGLTTGPVVVALERGRVEGSLTLDPQRVDLALTADDIPLDLARLVAPGLGLDGTVSARLGLSGRPEAPEGTLRLRAEGVALRDPRTGDLPPLALAVEGDVANGVVALRAVLSGVPGTTAEAALRAPVDLSLRPFVLGLAAQGEVRADLGLAGEAGAVWALLPVDPHRLTGEVALDLSLRGRPGDFAVLGRAGLVGGTYENPETGTLLQGIAAELIGNGDRLELVRLEGRDASGGTVTGSGRVELDGLALGLRIEMTGLRIVQRDDVGATVTASLALDGPMAGPILSGAITVDPAEIRLVDRLPPGVVTLDVIEVGANVPPGRDEARARAAPFALGLDLAVDIPRRLFVRGRGLDSEWAGGLAVSGTSDDPRIVGAISPVRGQYELAGKVFRLERGTIAFAEGETLTPNVDLVLGHRGATIEATIAISGPATEPAIALRSVPELPQEEILSRVLFDRGTGSLSPAEALQLANAAASFGGIRGGGDILDDVRRRLGVDVLRVGGDEKGATVTAGTYLGDRVFVGATQGTGPESGGATVEVEVTPNLTVESDMGQNATGRVGVKWKWDY